MLQENFEFKRRSYDFIVQELLPFEFTNKGDVLFVYFEKTNKNTMDVINFLCKEFDISSKAIGIGGLKDKDAVARQWLCIYKSTLKKVGGDKAFLNELAKMTKVIKCLWHDKPLSLLDNIQNRFFIRLRGKKAFSQIQKDEIKNSILEIMQNGVPNYFGSQRFGVNFRNISIGKDILTTKKGLNDKFETKFKLQAYSSYIFNKFVDFRIRESKEQVLDGDIFKIGNEFGYYQKSTNQIMIFENNKNSKFFYHQDTVTRKIDFDDKKHNITGPNFGYNTLLANPSTESGKLEIAFMEKYEINEKNLEIFKSLGIYGLRRNLRVKPTEYELFWKGDDIIINFTLGKGNYASIIIDKILSI